jgi:hypothetical protein
VKSKNPNLSNDLDILPIRIKLAIHTTWTNVIAKMQG